jgi:hypothetical protein
LTEFDEDKKIIKEATLVRSQFNKYQPNWWDGKIQDEILGDEASLINFGFEHSDHAYQFYTKDFKPSLIDTYPSKPGDAMDYKFTSI